MNTDEILKAELDKELEGSNFSKKHYVLPKVLAAGVCFAVMICALVLYCNYEYGRIRLSNSENVTARYVDSLDEDCAAESAELMPLTQSEVIAQATDIFTASVTKIENIKLSFSGEETYRAVATVEVKEPFNTNLGAGESVEILLPCAIGENLYTEDCEAAEKLEDGTNALFLATRYTNDDTWEENGGTLYLNEIAEYGLPDGARFLIVENSEGISFDEETFTELNKSMSLDEAAKIITDSLS